MDIFDENVRPALPVNINYNIPKIKVGPSPEELRELDRAYERNRKAQEAQVKTAQNTEDMKNQINIVIRNQNEYIDILKSQNQHILHVLENIFASSEDTAIVQKEILKIMNDKGVNEELIKDKGMDVFVQGLFTCINILLAKYGISL